LGLSKPAHLFQNKNILPRGTLPKLVSVSSSLVSVTLTPSTLSTSSLVSVTLTPSSLGSCLFSSQANILWQQLCLFSSQINIMAKVVNTVRFALIVCALLSFVAIPNQPHDFPTSEYRKCLPKFSGYNVVSVKDHLTHFLKFADNLEVEYEHVVMKMFMQTLEGDART